MTPAAWISLVIGLLSIVGSALGAAIAVKVALVRNEQQLISMAAKLGEIQAKLDTHIQLDMVAHERIRGAEVLLEQTDKKLTDVDGRRHRYQAFNDEAVRDIRQLVADKMDGMHRWISETLVGALKS